MSYCVPVVVSAESDNPVNVYRGEYAQAESLMLDTINDSFWPIGGLSVGEVALVWLFLGPKVSFLPIYFIDGHPTVEHIIGTYSVIHRHAIDDWLSYQ